MRLWLSIISNLLITRRDKKLATPDADIKTPFRAWPWDIDQNLHLNNACYVMSMEISRQKYTVQSGFLKAALANGWYGPVVAQKIIYFKPIRPFQRYVVGCRIIYADEQWLFFRQNITVNDKMYAVGLVKVVVKKGKQTIPSSEVFKAIGVPTPSFQMPPDIASWDEANEALLGAYKNER